MSLWAAGNARSRAARRNRSTCLSRMSNTSNSRVNSHTQQLKLVKRQCHLIVVDEQDGKQGGEIRHGSFNFKTRTVKEKAPKRASDCGILPMLCAPAWTSPRSATPGHRGSPTPPVKHARVEDLPLHSRASQRWNQVALREACPSSIDPVADGYRNPLTKPSTSPLDFAWQWPWLGPT